MGNRLYYTKVFFLQYRVYVVLGLLLFSLGFGAAVFLQRHRPPMTEEEYVEALKTGSELFDARRYAEAYEYLVYPAQQGYPKARLLLGQMYYNGWGTDRDAKLAFENFKSASEALPEAGYMVAKMTFRGEAKGMPKGQATKLLTQAAYGGNADAQADLGVYSFLSDDAEPAYFWLSLAARGGNGKAQEVLPKAAEKVSSYQRSLLDAEIEGFVPRK
jgi:TPR repeat protein